MADIGNLGCRSINSLLFLLGYLLSRVITSVFFIISYGGLFDREGRA